eukprot:5386957-Amphidinium_carterae.2
MLSDTQRGRPAAMQMQIQGQKHPSLAAISRNCRPQAVTNHHATDRIPEQKLFTTLVNFAKVNESHLSSKPSLQAICPTAHTVLVDASEVSEIHGEEGAPGLTTEERKT